MEKRILFVFFFLAIVNALFANGDDPIVTLCSGKKMTWKEYQFNRELRSNKYDIEIDYISANEDFIAYTPSMMNINQGAWSSVIDVPLVAASMANLPDGKVLMWSAKDKLSFGGNQGKTWTAIYDPMTNNISEFLIDQTNHDMFCPGISTLPDGSIIVTGGSSSNKSSVYDPYTGDWSTAGNMNIARGYHSNVTLATGATMVIGGSWSGGQGNKHAEIWSEKSGWFRLPGVPVNVITDGVNSNQPSSKDDYFPWLWVAPNGKLFHAGPSQTMHWIDTEGVGNWESAGLRGDDVYSSAGNTVMFDIGKILKVGGGPTFGNGGNANTRSYVIDINNDDPIVTRVEDMQYSRANFNSVVLPSGEVLSIGGLATSNEFTDNNARYYAELWDPNTGNWTTMAQMAVPRTYHSTAILMKDGRVMSSGGGLCGGCSVNHPDAEIFSPPYLFNPNGTLATRPVITNYPASVDYNSSAIVNTNTNISSFVFIRLSGTTHSTNNDQRRIPLSFSTVGNNQYQLNIPNRNILPPGNYMLFAMNNNGTPSIAETIKIGDDINDCTPVANPDLGGTGLAAKYYNNSDFTNLANTQVDPTVNFNYGTGSPAANMNGETFSIRWQGSIKVPREGAYTFYTNSDDGVRLWVDGKPIVDNWTLHGPTEDVGIINLEPGKEYSIRLDYFESNGGAVIQLNWSGPGIEKQIIPKGNLFPVFLDREQNTRIGDGPWLTGNTVTICEGQTAYFDYTGSFGNGWSFKYIRPDGAWSDTNPNSDGLGKDVLKIAPPFTSDNHPNEGVWTVEITNPDGFTISQNFELIINPSPQFACEFNIDNTGWFVENDCTLSICEGQSLSFSTPGCDDELQIELSGPNGFYDIQTGGCHNISITDNAALNLAGTYTATFTQISTGCSSSKDVVLSIDANPEVLCYFNVGDGWEQVCDKTVCNGSPVTFSAHPAINSGVTWSWTGPNGFSANTRTAFLSNNATPEMSGLYTVTYTNSNGCTSSEILILTVDDACNYCPTIGETCNDNDPCTINDIYDEDCNCVGTFQDSDGDGVCNAQDICEGGDDNIDTDNDGIPNACDNCNGLFEDKVTVSIQNEQCEESNGSITFSFLDEASRTNIQFSLNSGLSWESSVPDNSGSKTYAGLTAGNYDLMVRWGNGDCPESLGPVFIGGKGGLPTATVSTSNVSCGGNEGAITFTFSDEEDRTAIEFSLDGGNNWKPSVADNSGSKTYSGLTPGEYDLMVRWGNNDCPINLEVVNIFNTDLGQSCDDNNDCTINDEYDENCNCVGTVQDSDGDGICDAEDICAGGDDTIDIDNDGVPDACDECVVVGQPCNDNDLCTIEDVYDEACNCVGTYQDSDGDGVCDAEDICVGGDDTVDVDNDGVPDACDDCILVGQPCNDNDPCTISDVYDENCNCAGTYQDSDGDGICNAEDLCEGGDDNEDIDGDGIPDACDVIKPTQSNTVLIDEVNGKCWIVNPDNNTVTAVSLSTLTKSLEVNVGEKPSTLAQAPDGSIWVVNQLSHSITVLNPLDGSTLETIILPRGTDPFAIIFSIAGDYAYISLETTAQVFKINAESRSITDTLSIGLDDSGIVPRLRGLAMTTDNRLLATRFISNNPYGEVYEINPEDMTLVRTFVLANDPGPDTPFSGRGIPNYINNIVISPDGNSAWIPSKKDNINRGFFRDGLALNHDNTVRAVVSKIDLINNEEILSARIDFDDRERAVAATFSPSGDLIFVALQGNNAVRIINAANGFFLGEIPVGAAPQGLIIDESGRLFVQNFMDRSLSVIDVSTILNEEAGNFNTLAEIDLVNNELLSTQELLGKQIFYNAATSQMSLEGYLSCASCHLEGGQDGQIWDFTDRGEGLRNTTALRGRGNDKHGRLHWSANFDEVQDFESVIRSHFGGAGFMTEADFEETQNPLGVPTTGRSEELDAIAAYISSLSEKSESPYRNEDGTLTPMGTLGKQVFIDNDCTSCHGGQAFTDSPSGLMHDIGTLKEGSGQRLGQPLLGIDVPTLRELWMTAPYLHDGSATTLGDAVNAHNNLSLTDTEVNQLVSFLIQLDEEQGEIAGTAIELAIVEPLNASIFTEGDIVTLDIETNIDDINQVVYYANGVEIALTTSAPYQAEWFEAEIGEYEIFAKVYYENQTIGSLSAPVYISVIECNTGESCDDNNDCTTDDTYDAECNCIGIYLDSDDDGVCDAEDICQGGDDNLDTDGDGIPDFCDGDNPTADLVTSSLEVTEAFELRINFNTVVAGLSQSDFAITNGTLQNDLSNVGTSYYVTIVPTNPGVVSIQLPANSVEDIDGNGNLISNVLEVNYTVTEINNPVATLVTSSLEVEEAFELRINFNTLIEGLSIDDFEITNGTLQSDLSNVGTSYYVTVVPQSSGIVRIQLPENSVTDLSGTGNLNSNILEVNYSGPEIESDPTATIITSSLDVNEAFEIRIIFNAAVSGLSIDDFTISNGNLQNDLSNVGTSYFVTIVPINPGVVSIHLPANSVIDAGGNGNLLSNVLEVNYLLTENGEQEEFCLTINNVALTGTATQSSDYNGGGGAASLAIDGNTNGDWFADLSVASTAWENQAYWELDLGASFNIEDINIWNRTDCCADFLSKYYVLVSEQPFVSDNLDEVLTQSGVQNFKQSEVAGSPSTIPVETTGRFIRIQHKGTGFMALAEVEVMGCPVTNVNSSQNAFLLPQTARKGIDAVLYPNPVEKHLFVKYEVAKEGEMRYFIVDSKGMIHRDKMMHIEKGNDILTENIASLPAGLYVFYMQVDGFKYVRIPFVKIRD